MGPKLIITMAGLAGLAAVPPDMAPQEVEALARELRHTYDNINIQVFDDIETARNYADLGKSSADHLVLSISRHKHLERDNMVRFVDGVAIEVQ